MAALREDVDAGLHVTMKPSELQATRPDVYGEWDLKLFDQRLRQAIRKKRMVNWMNDKREATDEERKERRRNLCLSEETPQQHRKRVGDQSRREDR